MKLLFGTVFSALLLVGTAARADADRDSRRDSGRHEESDDGYVVNDASKVAFAQRIVGLGGAMTERASAVGFRYAAAFKTTYLAAKGDVSSSASLSFNLEKGINGSFSLWSLAADDRNDDRRKECKDGDDNDADRSASLKITYLARGEKAFVNQERAAVAARVEAMILHKASGLVAGLFGKNVMKIDLCAADVSEREMVGGCSASVLEFTATVVPFSPKVLAAWEKDTKVGCGAVGLVQQISQETQCLSLAGHAAREKNPYVEISRVDVISMAKVESSALLVAAPTVAASAMVAVAPAADTAKAVAVVRMVPPPTSGLYESCQEIGGGGGGEIPGPVKR